jgi:XTP/dITP diphosphohydrolase
MAKPKQLLIATSNEGKFREMSEILGETDFELLSLQDLGISADFDENGSTFEENALGKALYYAQKSGLLTLAEDSGIMVDALQGELGVKTRRWGKGGNVSDEEWIEFFLSMMKAYPDVHRGASFVCVAVLLGGGKSFVAQGKTNGTITHQLEAPLYPGLPLSSCFRPVGYEKVYAALEAEEKNRISHRGKALQQVKDFLSQNV